MKTRTKRHNATRHKIGRCESCRATARLYQYDMCKDCLIEEFVRLRVLINAERPRVMQLRRAS